MHACSGLHIAGGQGDSTSMTTERTGADSIELARKLAAETIASDERLLGLLPDDLSEQLLRWALERFWARTSDATSMEEVEQAAGEVRSAARTLGEAAADAGDDADALRARLDAATPDTVAAAPPPSEAIRPAGASDGDTPTAAPLIQSVNSSQPSVPQTGRQSGRMGMRKVARQVRRWFG